jgi:hypothetical protein
MIVSEQQAHEIGALTGGSYTVFWYEHRKTRLTLFMVALPNGTKIMQDPRAAAPRNLTGE